MTELAISKELYTQSQLQVSRIQSIQSKATSPLGSTIGGGGTGHDLNLNITGTNNFINEDLRILPDAKFVKRTTDVKNSVKKKPKQSTKLSNSPDSQPKISTKPSLTSQGT